ncbi:MAG: carbon starvation protein A [Gemmataceae bacterium]|nr:carbon starvation protein A [Gemmataceae bacterium]
MTPVLANLLYETAADGRHLYHAMPLLLGALCIIAIAYRYYSAFLAAKVAALDDARITPAHVHNDGQNYHPTKKWVLFGHHFAAISGAGPLIGPVLAIQYGYFPGLLWLVIGVCLAGAVQDMLVLAASVRRGGKSLAEIARVELGRWAAVVVSAAILFIVVIALAGLGFVVVKALGGEEVGFGKGTDVAVPAGTVLADPLVEKDHKIYAFPEGCSIVYPAPGAGKARPISKRSETFRIQVPAAADLTVNPQNTVVLPEGAALVIKGSSWGTFTIFCTIPIALFVGLYMYKIRKGRVVEASLIGAAGVLAATVIGNWVPDSPLEPYFSLSRKETILALTGYGFIASVLPVWLLLCPRDYLSSFLKIGTIGLLILGVFAANPVLECPPVNTTFQDGGPTFSGAIFPFVFICIMCGAISGFHALVASGTTPKMVDKESQVRVIGYGAMLMEGVVGIVALIAAASMPPKLYYDINVDQKKVPKFQAQLDSLYKELGNVEGPGHLPVEDRLGQVESQVQEQLRGRTGGAVTLAVSMAEILKSAMLNVLGVFGVKGENVNVDSIMKYWFHFAIMFEALFILTTIDTGTRIARFLLQEALGKVHPRFEQTDWVPGAVLATLVVTVGWGALVWTGEIDTIWPMFGIANQLLAVVALTLVTTMLVNSGRAKYAPITLLPMLFVTATTLTAATQMIGYRFPAMIADGDEFKGVMNICLTVFVVVCVGLLLLIAVSRWIAVVTGAVPVRPDEVPIENGTTPAEPKPGAEVSAPS